MEHNVNIGPARAIIPEVAMRVLPLVTGAVVALSIAATAIAEDSLRLLEARELQVKRLLEGAPYQIAQDSYRLLETREDLAKRRQAEQYEYEQRERRQGNELNTEKPRPLGEGSPSLYGASRNPYGGANNKSGNCLASSVSC